MLFGVVTLVGGICGLRGMSRSPGFSLGFPQIFFLLISCFPASYQLVISTTFKAFDRLLVLFGTVSSRSLSSVMRGMIVTIVVWVKGRFGCFM